MAPSVQLADIGGDRIDLRLGEIMRDRLHDRRIVGFGLVLPAFLVPIGQLAEDIIGKLAGEPRKSVGALGVLSMARGARRHIGARHAVLKIFLPSAALPFNTPPSGFGSRLLKYS